MATKTGKSGSWNWNDANAWVEGAWVDGDNAVIPDGATYTIPVGYRAIAGSQPADDISTPAIQNSSTSGTGIVIINGTLEFRGTIKQSNATWQANAGAVIEHNSGANPGYSWFIGTAANQANSILKLIGTGVGANRVKFKNSAGSSRFGGFSGGATLAQRTGANSITGNYAGSCRIEAYFTTFTNLGPATTEWLTSSLGAGHKVILEDCLVDGCALLNIPNGINASSVFRFLRTSFLNPSQANSLQIYMNTNLVGGERRIENVIMEGSYIPVYSRDVTIKNTALAGTSTSAPITGGSQPGHVEFADILVYNRKTSASTESITPFGPCRRLISLRVQVTTDDDHFRTSFGLLPPNPSIDIDGAIVEYAGTSIAGDCFDSDGVASATPVSYSIKNVLVLPNAAGGVSNNLLPILTTGANLSQMSFYVMNNTMVGGGDVLFFEVSTGAVGIVKKITNNLIYRQALGSGRIENSTTTPVDGAIVTADYNASHNVNTALYASSPTKYQSTPGTHDIVADPQFKDPTLRNWLKWGQSINPAIADWPSLWAEIRKRNDDSGYDTRYNWENAYAWIRDGYTPTNKAYKGAGEGGVDIGAVPVAVKQSGNRSIKLKSGFSF